MENLIKSIIVLLATKALPNANKIKRVIYGSIATILLLIFIYVAVYTDVISSIKLIVNTPILLIGLFFGTCAMTNCGLRYAYQEMFNPIIKNENN